MLKDFARRITSGALVGAAVGALCIGVGVLRILLATASGRHVAPITSDDLKGLALYVGAFTVAGMLVTAIWPSLRTRPAKYVGFSLGGIVVTVAILAFEKGGFAAADGVDWTVTVLLGILFGCAFAYGYTRDPAA